jgi:hypothetical protein
MSAVVAVTVVSEPNRTYTNTADELVTTTLSPPPVNGMFAETLVAAMLTVPVGRKGLTEPIGMTEKPFLCR